MSTVLSCLLTFSIGTTASAPWGTTAPVEMATAPPASSGPPNGVPAADSPTMRNVPGRSAARTAKPSIAELANGGRSTRARTSSAPTRPPASAIGTLSTGSRRACPSTRSCASSRLSSGATGRTVVVRPGDEVAGRYRLEELQGHGPMSEVWRAHDDTLDRTVAVKILSPTADLGRFRREAQVLATLAHENVMRVYDYGEDEAGPFMALEWLHGGTLEERLAQGPLPPAETLASPGASRRASRNSTTAGSFTAISSRRTSSSTRKVGRSSATSGWPAALRGGHADRGRDGAGYGRVPLARASRRRAGRAGERRLLVRRDPVPDADGRVAVRGRRAACAPEHAPARASACRRGAATRCASRPRCARGGGAPEGPGTTAGRRERAAGCAQRRGAHDAHRPGGHGGDARRSGSGPRGWSTSAATILA